MFCIITVLFTFRKHGFCSTKVDPYWLKFIWHLPLPLKKLSKNKPERLHGVSYALNPGILKYRLGRVVDCWDTLSLWLKNCWGYQLRLLQAARKEHFKDLYLLEFTPLCSSTLFWKRCFYSTLWCFSRKKSTLSEYLSSIVLLLLLKIRVLTQAILNEGPGMPLLYVFISVPSI